MSPALPELSVLHQQNYVVLLDSTLPRSQYDYVLPQVSFTAVGYHKHITLFFSPTVSKSVAGMSSAICRIPWLLLGCFPILDLPRHLSSIPCTGACYEKLVMGGWVELLTSVAWGVRERDTIFLWLVSLHSFIRTFRSVASQVVQRTQSAGVGTVEPE